MTKHIEKENLKVVCPHCGKKSDSVWVCTLESTIGVRYIYFCPNCQHDLGIYMNKNNIYEDPGIKVLA